MLSSRCYCIVVFSQMGNMILHFTSETMSTRRPLRGEHGCGGLQHHRCVQRLARLAEYLLLHPHGQHTPSSGVVDEDPGVDAGGSTGQEAGWLVTGTWGANV